MLVFENIFVLVAALQMFHHMHIRNRKPFFLCKRRHLNVLFYIYTYINIVSETFSDMVLICESDLFIFLY